MLGKKVGGCESVTRDFISAGMRVLGKYEAFGLFLNHIYSLGY